MKTYPVTFVLNGKRRRAEAAAHETLLHVLRDKLGAKEVKNGCAKGDCGACTVLLEGRPVNACLTLAAQANGKEIVTGSWDNPTFKQISKKPLTAPADDGKQQDKGRNPGIELPGGG